MIRSLIGFACVLSLMMTCFQTSAAQPRANLSANPLRSNAAALSLDGRAQSGFRAISDRILSSDAYHDDFRFRAAPVKRSANWQMPIVSMRPAKQIVSNFVSPTTIEQNAEVTFEFEIANLVDFVWVTAEDASAEFCQLRDRFEEITLAIVPRPIAGAAVAKGRKDYWNYYADCDRWNVVFAIAWQRAAVQQEQKSDYPPASRFPWDESAELFWDNVSASWQSSWEEIAATYLSVAQQFSVSRE